jgi:hypothetical protein
MDKTNEPLLEALKQQGTLLERLTGALEKLGGPPPMQDPNVLIPAQLRMARGADRVPIPTHTTAFEGSITDPSTAAPLRVTGKATFQRWKTALPGPDGDGRGPAIWRCIEIPEDNFGHEESDLRRVFDKEFTEKNRDDIQRAPEDPERAAHLRAKHAKDFRVAVFTRGRRPLHNLLLGKSAEQIASTMTLADPPPPLADQVSTPEVVPVAAAVSEDPLRAILRAGV